MANRYSIGSGLASNPAVWDGGVSVPVSGDRVLITVGTTIELDGAYEWGDDSTATITINTVSTTRGITLRGKLSHSRSVNSSITCRGGFQIDSGGEHDMGTVASPIPQGVVAACYVNKSNASPSLGKYNYECLTGGKFTYVGVYRKRHTVLTAAAAASATTIYVEDATGWQVGDILHITGDNSGQHQNITIAAGYTPGSLTVPLSAALTTAKRLGIAVGNASSNVIITSQTTATRGGWSANTGVSEAANSREIRNAAMIDLVGSYPMNAGVLFRCVDNYGGTRYLNPYTSLDSIAFGQSFTGTGLLQTAVGVNISYLPNLHFTNCAFLQHGSLGFSGTANFASAVTVSDSLFGNVTPIAESNYLGALVNCKIVITQAGSSPLGSTTGNATTLINCKFSGVAYAGVQYSSVNVLRLTFIGCDFGVSLPMTSGNPGIQLQIAPVFAQTTFTNCNFAAAALLSTTSQARLTADSSIKVINKNADPTQQEDWRYNYAAIRSNTETYRGTSSIAMKPITAGSAAVRSQEIFCANGASIRLIGYIKSDALFYNGGGAGWFPPTASISGLGVTTGTVNGVSGVAPSFTGTSSATWEKYDITVTNTSGTDGYFSLNYTTNPRTVTTGTVYFDGVTEAPFVNKVRHYGFLFDETSPVRTVNPVVGVSEATAAGYSGLSIAWGTSSSSIALSADRSFQYVYDYSQYRACLNIASLPPLVGVGIAGSPSLFANGNVDTTGFTLNGAGSLAMGGFTLTASNPWPYTFTGGTFGQATTVPSFTGGQLNIGAAGNFTFGMSGGIISMTPTAPGTYSMGGATLSGTVDLRNTSAHAITVQLPAGASYTTANNTGGAITVTAPTILAYATATVQANTRVQLYNVTTSTELDNVMVTGTSYSLLVTAGMASSGDTLRLRACKLGQEDSESYGIWSSAAGVSFLVAQPERTAYTAWGHDGATVTEYSLDGPNMQIDANDVDGFTTKTRLAAFYCWALTTELGIRSFYGALSFLSAGSIRVNAGISNFKLQNINPTTPLVFTDVNVRLFRSDGSSVIAPDSYSIHNDYSGEPFVVETGTSGLTGAESSLLLSLPTAAATAGAVWDKVVVSPVPGSVSDKLTNALSTSNFLALK